MKKLTALFCAMLIVIASLSFVACSENSKSDFDYTESGYRFEMNEAILKISADLNVADPKDGYVKTAKTNISIQGVSKQLSYFDGSVKFTWNYEYLNDAGEYIPATYTVTVAIDADGKGTHKETVEFSGARSIRDLELTVEYSGYAVRK